MSDLDDLLGDEEEESQSEPKRDKDNAAFAQLRKEKKALEKEAEELRAYKATQEKASRSASVDKALKEAGVGFDVAEWYPADGDPSVEGVKAWAVSKGFLKAEEGESTGSPEPKAGFTPTVIPEGSALGSKMYTHEEFMELLQAEPDRAMQIHKAGRVALNKSPQTIFAGRDR